jgi:leucyl aminopeptidase
MRNLKFPVLCLFALSLGQSTIGQEPLHVVGYAQDPSLRELLVEQRALCADLGERGVARLSDALLVHCRTRGATCTPLVEPPAGQRLAVLFARTGTPDAAGLRVVARDGEVLFVLATPTALAAAKRPGIYAGGVQVLDTDDTYAPTVFVPPPGVDNPDPIVAGLVAQVQQANLSSHITALSAIQTRRADQPQNAQAVTYLQSQLAAIPGMVVTLDHFNSGVGPNVIGELPGREASTTIVMIGAHFDSYAGSGQTRSPGADDNASGTASVLEIARILASVPLRRTVRFGFWNAEEFGLWGSNAYAAAAQASNTNILAYLNADMNGYRASGDARDLDFVLNDSTPSLVTYLTQVSTTYVPSLPVVTGTLGGGTSDHRSFSQRGFPAVFYFEDAGQYSPYIHTSNDTLGQSVNDLTLSTQITQSMLAGMAELAQPLAAPGFTLNTVGGPTVGGTALFASGTDLQSVSAARVGGVPVPFTIAAGGISLVTPVAADVGAVDVEFDNPAGTGQATFTYALTSPPALRLPAGAPIGTAVQGAIGGDVGHWAVTLVSLFPGPTPLPLVVLGIGGGNPGSLLTHDLGPLSPGGATRTFAFQVPAIPALGGLVLHWQALTADLALQGLTTTNAVVLTVQ